jgi:predicted nucleic acid-binding protein
MKDVVIDSGVAVKWYVAEPYSTEARHLLRDHLNGNLTLFALDLIYADFGNIMWKKQALQGFSPADANLIVEEFRTQIEVSTTPAANLLAEAYRIAVQHKRIVYDSLYLALSLQLGCEFVTADERLVNAVATVFPQVVKLADWV